MLVTLPRYPNADPLVEAACHGRCLREQHEAGIPQREGYVVVWKTELVTTEAAHYRAYRRRAGNDDYLEAVER